jgi:ABC-type transporter Mla subunit MlaD
VIDRRRMTERISPSLLRLELRRATLPLIVLAIGFGVAALAGDYILNNINGGVGSTHTIKVQVATATGVVPERAEVRFEGIAAGLVQSVDLVNGHAVLTASVADRFGPIYKNATIAVRPNTALQDMYMDVLSRGTPSAGKAGGSYVIPMSQTTSPVNVSEVLDVFEPGVRAHLYDVLNELGNGLQDRGAMLRRAFVDLAPLVKIAGQASGQLAVRSDYTRELVHNAAILTSVLARRSRQLHTVILAGTRTLQALSTEGGVPLQQTLRDLPPMLATIPRMTDSVDRLVVHLSPAITDLYPVADGLPSALANLRSFAGSADPAVRALRVPVVKLVPLSTQLKPFSAQLANSLGAIEPQTGYINHIASKVAACPLALYAFFNWSDSVGKFHDGLGAYPRGDFGFGLESSPTFRGGNMVTGSSCSGGTTLEGVPTPGFPGPPRLTRAFP